ncbi:hypothetical protein [Pseudomonas sp.]|uniref:hypothetical protein n=1 Tax=Pseudomonas sp. TaxID=306 RepID=UPI002FCC17F6
MKTKELLSQARDCAKNCDPKGLSVSGPNFKVTEYFRAPHLLGEVADRLEVVQEGYDKAISSSVTWEARATKEASRAEDLLEQRDELLAALEAAVECGMVPTSSATEGGAMRYVKQAHVADQIRAAISKAKGGASITKITGETK